MKEIGKRDKTMEMIRKSAKKNNNRAKWSKERRINLNENRKEEERQISEEMQKW